MRKAANQNKSLPPSAKTIRFSPSDKAFYDLEESKPPVPAAPKPAPAAIHQDTYSEDEERDDYRSEYSDEYGSMGDMYGGRQRVDFDDIRCKYGGAYDSDDQDSYDRYEEECAEMYDSEGNEIDPDAPKPTDAELEDCPRPETCRAAKAVLQAYAEIRQMPEALESLCEVLAGSNAPGETTSSCIFTSSTFQELFSKVCQSLHGVPALILLFKNGFC